MMTFEQFKKSLVVLLCINLAVFAAHADNHHNLFVADDIQDEEKISSKNLGSDELFLGFEAPLFESIQSQWGALVSAASMSKEDYLAGSIEPLKVGFRTIWSTQSSKSFTPFVSTSVATQTGGGQDNASALTCSLGAGFQHTLYTHVNAGVSYAVADKMTQPSIMLQTNHLYTHSFLLSLSYKA